MISLYEGPILKKIIHFGLNFPGHSDSKESACDAGDLGLVLSVRKIPWRREGQPTPVFLPAELHGQTAWWATVHGLKRVGHDLATK